MDQDDLPPGFEGTAWTPAHSTSDESVQENPTTSTDVHVDSTASRPVDVGEIIGAGDGVVSESPSLVETGTQVPSEPEEVYGEDIAADAVEAANSVTRKPLGGIDEEVEEDGIVSEGSEEDDKIPEVSPEEVGVPGSEVIEEATPHGEEPPSETVAEEVFTEATVAVLVRPTTANPTEAGPLEDVGQDVSLEPTAEVKTEAVVEDVQETITEGAESHEVEEPADDSLDISTNVEVTEEQDTTVTETPADAPESAETAVPGDAEGDAQTPPEEHPSEAASEVSQDTIGVSTAAAPTVFLITSDDSEEAELEPLPGFEMELPSQGSVQVEVTARPPVVTLQDETQDEDVSFVTEATQPATAFGVTEATMEDKPEEEGILVEAAEKPEEEVEAEEAWVEEAESATVKTTNVTDVNEPTMTAVSEAAEEELKNEDAAVAEGEVVHTDEEKLTEEPEETIFTAEDTTEPSVQLTTEVGETVDEAATEREESTEVSGQRTEAPVEPEEEQAEETVEIVEPPVIVETIKPSEAPAEPLPEPTEETELREEPTNEAEQAETDAEEQGEPAGEPVQEADITKEVEEEEAPVGGEDVSEEDESDLDVMPSENTEEATGEPLEDQEEATIVEIMTEDTGVSELETEGTQPEVLEEATLETFDLTTPGSDEVITLITAVVPEDIEGFLPESDVEELPEEEVKVQLPEDSELEVQPDTTNVPPQVLEPIEEVSDSEDFDKVVEEVVPEIPSVVPEEVVTHTWTSTKVGAIEPDKVTQDGFPKGHVVSVEDSVLQEVEALPPDAEAEDVEEMATEAPVAATSESHHEILPESTTETERGTTMKAPEEPTSMAPLKPTPKYVVEYNNGNFPDLTESPYFVDDNLLGNNGFGLDEDENSVSFHEPVLQHRFTSRRFSRPVQRRNVYKR